MCTNIRSTNAPAQNPYSANALSNPTVPVLDVLLGGLLFEVGTLGFSCLEPFRHGVLEGAVEARPTIAVAIDQGHIRGTDPGADDAADPVPAFIVERRVREPVSLDELPDHPFLPQEDGFVDDGLFPDIAVDAGPVTAIG